MKPLRPIPGWISGLTLICGPWPMLAQGCAPEGKVIRGLLFLHGMVPAGLAFVFPLNWLFIAAFTLVWNASIGIVLLASRPATKRMPLLGQTRGIRAGLVAGLSVLPFGLLLVAMEQWASDWAWSSLYPINSSLGSISLEVLLLWETFALVLLFSALQAGKWQIQFTPIRLLRLLFFSFAGFLILSQLWLLIFTIPVWQLQEREVFPTWVETLRQVIYHVVLFVTIPVITANSWALWNQEQKVLRQWFRNQAALVLALISLAFMTGMPIYYALILGREQEKQARPERAIPYYSKALTWSRSDKLNAYLQFRVGLLLRKQGRIEEAREAFMKVLVKYPHDNDLLLQAYEFNARLERDSARSEKRVVIPGIEARTEYKNAYCVPNSLGLVLNYWGDRTGAKTIGSEITQLDQGSFITDAVYFTERRGLRMWVLPMRGLEDLFHLIDNGFPVLTFIPGHVLAVFGYDRALQTLVTYDVSTVDIWDDQRWASFSRDWSQEYNAIAVVAPESRRLELEKILGGGIEEKSEAYIQVLLAGLLEEDNDAALKHLRRASGQGLFFADWQRQRLEKLGGLDSAENQSAQKWLMDHSMPEGEILSYLRSQYEQARCHEVLDFLERYAKENQVSQSMTLIQAGCLNQVGKNDSAAETLSKGTEARSLPSPVLGFMLNQPWVRDDASLAHSFALDALSQEEGLDGETAKRAIDTYLENSAFDSHNLDEGLATLEGYLIRHNAYDTTAIEELIQIAAMKRFKPEDEIEHQVFDKRMDLWRLKLRSLKN